MRLRLYPWQLAAAIILVCAGIWGGLQAWRSHHQLDAARLIEMLPRNKGAIVYLDFATLRTSGLLDALSGAKATEEPDYRKFVQDTGFDYRLDLDSVAVAFVEGNMYAVVRGAFQWKRLAEYAAAQGGSCLHTVCKMPASQPDRFISFYPLRNNILALAVSHEDHGIDMIGPAKGVTVFSPTNPIAVSAPGSTFEQPTGLPPGAQAFLSPLARSKRATFYAGSAGQNLELTLDAECASPQDAQAIVKQLQDTTELLKNMLSREKMTSSPADLSGLLVAGTFEAKDTRVSGRWPLDRRFVEGLLR